MTIQLYPWMRDPLTCAAKMGFLSKRFWNHALASGQRSWRLEKWRMLQSSGLMIPASRYSLTDQFLILAPRGEVAARQLGLNPIPAPLTAFISHDECVLELALKLERAGLISEWQTEGELKKQGRTWKQSGKLYDSRTKFPDLIVRLAVPGKAIYVAIEIELTVKSKERYREFVNRYKTIEGIDSVIVLANNPAVERGIKTAQYFSQYPKNQRPILFGMIDDILPNPGAGILDLDESPITLNELVRSLAMNRQIA